MEGLGKSSLRADFFPTCLALRKRPSFSPLKKNEKVCAGVLFVLGARNSGYPHPLNDEALILLVVPFCLDFGGRLCSGDSPSILVYGILPCGPAYRTSPF
jgi:hypothetical protein